MFLIESQIELLKITDAGADVRDFINGDGLAQSRAAGQHGHERQQQHGGD